MPVQDDELVVVGDRLFTDVVMANRMARRSTTPSSSVQPAEKVNAVNAGTPAPAAHARARGLRTGPLSVWTTGVWEREAMGVRFLEKSFMEGIRRYVVADNGVEARGGDVTKFVKPDPIPEEPLKVERPSLVRRLWNRVRRAP